MYMLVRIYLPSLVAKSLNSGHDRGISVIQQTDELGFIGAQKIDIYRYPQNLGYRLHHSTLITL